MSKFDKGRMWRKYFGDTILNQYNYDGSNGKDKFNGNPIFRLLFGKDNAPIDMYVPFNYTAFIS